ncbi:MAG: nucleotide exchange factor GrpE, partial [bacterium]
MITKDGNKMTADVKSKTNGKRAGQKAKATSKTSTESKLNKRIQALETEKNDLKEQLLRKAAEFDNYKKRTESEFSRLVKGANADLITELLPVLDDLERSLTSFENENVKNSEDFHRGVSLIFKNLSKVLEKRGVKAIEAIGQEFDPEKHDALMQVESKEHPPNTVV